MIRSSQFLLFQFYWFSNIQILCWRTSDLRSNVEHLAVLKLLITKLTKANRVNQVLTKLTNPNQVNQVITKLTNPNTKLKPISAAISTAENHGKTATTENHEGDFLLRAFILNHIVLVQKSGYSSQATSTSSLWPLLLEWLPVRLWSEGNFWRSHAEPALCKAASIRKLSTAFKCRLSA